ncbi:MAG: hypothetical protein K8T20_16340, partial [Planctomycetes bacterium]|nr:hypothetical protein [Planctomycetota bacterium]
MGRRTVSPVILATAAVIGLGGAFVAAKFWHPPDLVRTARPPAAATGGATPEEAFATAMSAADKKDWGGFMAFTDEASVDMLLMTMAFAAGVSASTDDALKAEFDALGAKHRIRGTDPSEFAAADKQEIKAAARRMFAHVENKAMLFGDLMSFLEKHGRPGSASQFSGATLKEIRVTGDTARGSFENRDGKRSPIDFVKRDGRW